MGRGKLSMELISCEKSRMITYQKRTNGLLKKAKELSILCDIQTCVIIFGPKVSNTKYQLTELATFPKDHNRVTSIINKFNSKPLSNTDDPPTRRRSSNNLSDFFAVRKKKIDEEEVARLRKENLESKYPSWDVSLNGLSIEQLKAIAERLEPKLDAAKRKIRVMGKMKSEPQHRAVVGDWAEHSLFGSTSQFHASNNSNTDYLHSDPQGYNYNQFQPETQQFPAYYSPNTTLPMFLFGLNPAISVPTMNDDKYGQSHAVYVNSNNNMAIEEKVSAWNDAAALESSVLYNLIPRPSVWPNSMQQQQPMMMPHQQYQYGQQLGMPQPAAANGYGSLLNGSVPEFYEYFGDNKMPKS